MERSELLSIIETSLAVSDPGYAQVLAQHWLTYWHNDIGVRFGLARAFVAQKQYQPAHSLLVDLAAIDPENANIQAELAKLSVRLELHDVAQVAYAALYVLTGAAPPASVRDRYDPPPWLGDLRKARVSAEKGDRRVAQQLLEAMRPSEHNTPLAALTLLNIHWRARAFDAAAGLVTAYHGQWPDCVAFLLCQADCQLQQGNHRWAVAWLHEASALDPAADVVARYWGTQHDYTSLWPPVPPFELPAPLPDAVANVRGSNRLPAPSVKIRRKPTAAAANGKHTTRPRKGEHPHRMNETLRSIEGELAAIRARLAGAKPRHRKPKQRKDGLPRGSRRPVHVVVTSSKRLQQRYGVAGSLDVLSAVHALVEATRLHSSSLVRLLLVDDGDNLGRDGLTPVDPTSPWEIKHLLADLDTALGDRGLAIGSMLLVGGDDIVPFHRLPNPVDDSDNDVPSDNPYGSIDENYFIPEWPVGRIPGPCGSDAAPLIAAIDAATAAHLAATATPTGRLMALLRRLFRWTPALDSLGYSADIWRRPSLAVFRHIGPKRHFFTSPPHAVPKPPRRMHAGNDLAYFNLHGLEDTAVWYGQRRGHPDDEAPMYPVALTPDDVPNSGKAPKVVFTEACFGANIIEKPEVSDALCLSFLRAGSKAVIGSTKIAYGSVQTPLIGADLLGAHFWRAMQRGLPVGEALRRARLALAETMNRRQGFLDGEDQKTLISFVLYGDPLLTLGPTRDFGGEPKAVKRRKDGGNAPQTLNAKGLRPLDDDEDDDAAPIRALVSKYLPGMDNADLTVLDPLATDPANAKVLSGDSHHRVYGAAKTVRLGVHQTQHFARVTVNGEGKVVKMAVSK